MSIVDFVRHYYIDPMVSNQGYNFVSTLTYALIVVIATYLTFKLLQKMKIKVDKHFVTSVMVFVVFGTMVRLLEEAGIFSSYFLVTPMIWIETFIFALGLFLISKFIEKKIHIPYYKPLLTAGIILTLAPFALVVSKLTQFKGMAISLGMLIPFTAILYFVRWKLENKLVSISHIFDAVSTFTAVQFFGFSELHIIPRFLVTTLSPLSYIIVKVVVVIGILVLIDKYSNDKNFNNFLKLIIAIIGLGPAIRDFFMLGFIA